MIMRKRNADAATVFSLEQATAMLPLLRLIVADISYGHRELTARRADLHSLIRRKKLQTDELYSDEVEETRQDLVTESHQLDEYIAELENLGVILRSAQDGIVNFPTLVDDKGAFFIWRMGDSDITHWHWPSEGYADRKLIANLVVRR
jgi:hypothetical protein